MGRGIVHQPDDIRNDNPPSNPELLAYLEKELVNARYDLRHLYRLILNSRTYQQSCIGPEDAKSAALFARYPVRRLDAEVLVDALSWIGSSAESYSSPIPEPFTFVPEIKRTIQLEDGSIGSSFLELFGRPSRDTGLESERNNLVNDSHRLHLLNSTHVQKKINNSPKLRQIATSNRRDREQLIRETYLLILSRYPTEAELATVLPAMQVGGFQIKQAHDDLAWALINSKEFLYRH
jgi:hypothetical protein